MNTFRKIRAIRLDPPFQGIETVGDFMDFMGCCAVTLLFVWLLVWPQ